MKDADDTDNSGDSDTTNNEQNENEGDETGDNTDDDITTDIENPDGDQNESDDPESKDQPAVDDPNAGSDEELTDENKPAEEEPVSEEDTNFVDGEGEPVTVDAGKAVKVAFGNGTAAAPTKNADSGEIAADDTTAKVTFTGGLVDSEDGSSLVTGTDALSFDVAAKDGYQLAAVTYQIGSGADAQNAEIADDKLSASATIANADITDEVTITVTTKQLFTVNFGTIPEGVAVFTVVNGVNTEISSENAAATVPDGETLTFIAEITDTNRYNNLKVMQGSTELTEDEQTGLYTTNAITADATITITGVEKWTKVTIAPDTANDAVVGITFVEGVNLADGKIEAGKDVIFTVDISDAEKKIAANGVTCVYGDSDTAVTVSEYTDNEELKNAYKIASTDITNLADDTSLKVKVAVEAKKYQVTLPNGGTDVTWKYKGVGDATDFTATTGDAIEITSADTITLQASVTSDKKYSVTVGGLSEDEKIVDKNHPAEWTITRESFGEEETLDLATDIDVTELVTIKVASVSENDVFSVKYFELDGEKTEADALKADAAYKDAANKQIADVPVDRDVYLQITADREVTEITGATAVYGAIGTVYKVTPVTAAEGANTVTITLDNAAAKVVNITTDEHVKSVLYIPESGTPNRPVPGNAIRLASTTTKVLLSVTAADNYEVASVHVGGEAQTATEGVYEINLAAEGATEVKIATRKIMVEYTANITGGTKNDITISVEKASASGADPVTVSGNDVAYRLGSGDTYYVSATEKIAENAEAKFSKIEITSDIDGFKLNKNQNKQQFTAKKSDETESKNVINFVITAKANKTVSFDVSTNTAQLADKAIKYDKYKSLNGSEVEEKPAETEGAAIATYDVYEGTDFSFELAAAENYEIDTLTYTDAEGLHTLTAAADGKYTLANVTDNTEIVVKTKLAKASAYGIKINESPYVTGASVNWAGGTAEPATELPIGKEVLDLLTGNTAGKVNVGFTVKSGYTVEKVMVGTAEAVKPDGKTYWEVTLTKGATAEVTVQVKADTNTTDKYLTLAPSGEGYNPILPKIEVTAPSGLEPVKTAENGSKTYKMTGEVKNADGTVKTPGVDEITVAVTVEEGYTLDSSAAEYAGAVKTAEAEGKYTFTINAADVSATTVAAADTFTFTATKRKVMVKTDRQSNALESVVKYSVVGGQGQSVAITAAGSTAPVDNGDQLVVTVKAGDKLLVNGKEVELNNNSYTEVVELGKGLTADGEEGGDIYTFKAVNKETYKVKYEITHTDNTTDEGKIDGSDIDVTYGDKVTLSLDGTYADAKILSAAKTSEDESVSTAQVKENATTHENEVIVDVKDGGASFDVTLTVEKDSTTEYETTTLTPITFNTQLAPMNVTVKGITKGKEIKLNAASRMTYPLTIKDDGNRTVNAADYANMFQAAAADTSVATAEIVGGNLVIETKTTGKTDVIIKSVTQTGAEDMVFNFTVAGQDPKSKLKVKSLASSAQGMNDLYLDMTPDTGIKEVSDTFFDYYYEVNVTWKKGNDETPASHKTGYYYYRAGVDNNKLQALSQNIIVNTINPETNGDKCGNTYTFSAKMIAVEKGKAVTEGTPLASAVSLVDGKEFASDKAVAKDFSTRNKYYEDKLGVTKKNAKLYSGQENVLVALPKFSAKAGHIDDVKVTVRRTDGTLYPTSEDTHGNDYIDAAWNDSGDNGIYMTVGTKVTPGKYNLVIEATAHYNDTASVYDMYRATATMPFTVVRGISYIDLNAPAQIAMVEKNGKKKDVSVTLKPIGKDAYGDKAATQKFTYEFVSAVNAKNNAQVVVKNNKITVKAGFEQSADPAKNKFTVRINPADYTGNTHSQTVTFEATDEVLVPTAIYLAKSNGEKLADTLTTLEADEANVVVKAGSRVIDNSLLNITPAYTGKKTGYYSDYEKLVVIGKGALALKATTTDGGKKNTQKKYTITYPANVTYTLDTENSNGVGIYLKNGKYQYADSGNGQLNVQVNAASGSYDSYAYTRLFNYSVSVSGGKIVSKDSTGEYVIAPNKKETVITVTDKMKKGAAGKISFTYVNTNFKDVKAPSAKTTNKLYLAYDGNYSVEGQELKYTLKDNKGGYNAVKFTKVDDKSSEIVVLDGVYTINGKNEFTVAPYDDGMVYPQKVGTAKYNVVYGTKSDNGIFYPATKSATISVKVNKLGNMSPTAKYTINPVESLGVALTYKPADGVMVFDRVVSANVGGKKNKFFEFFELSEDHRKLQIKTAEYAKITAALTADPKNGDANFNPKEDLTGYLEYHYWTENGRVDKSVKITVAIKENQKVKYTASGINVLSAANAEAATFVTVGKNNPVYIANAKAVTEGWSAAPVKDGDAATNQVTLKSTNAPEQGKVEFYVIPADSPQKASTDFEKYGILVSAQVKVLKDDANTAKVKVDTKKNLTHTAEITGTTVTLTAEAVQGKEFTLVADGYAISKAEPVTAGADATEEQQAVYAALAGGANAIQMKAVDEGEAPAIVIKLDRDKAIAAAKSGIITIPVKLTFNKGTVNTEFISLKVKLNAVPTAAAVSADVKTKLNGHGLTASELATAAAAKAAMEAYAKDPENVYIDPMSGIVIDTIEAPDATKWGKGEGQSYAMNVTLKDVTAAADATPIAPVEITVTEAAAGVGIETAVGNAAALIVGEKSTDATVAATQMLATETTTADQIADWLQAAVAKSDYADKEYAVVIVSDLEVEAPTTAATGTLSYSYKVVHSLKPYDNNTIVSEATETVTLPQKAATTTP